MEMSPTTKPIRSVPLHFIAGYYPFGTELEISFNRENVWNIRKIIDQGLFGGGLKKEKKVK